MSRFSSTGWRPLAGIVLSAALFGLYSRGGYAYLLGFLALVPWLLVLNTITSTAASVRSGLLMSIVFVAAVFAWFGVAIGAYTGIGSATGLFVVLLAAPLLQAQFIAFALVRYLAGRRYGAVVRALAAASAWVATEWCIPRLLGDTIGHGLYPSPILRQIADVGGAAGLTFLLIIVNECVASAITHRADSKRVLAKPLTTAASIIVVMAGYGMWRMPQFQPTLQSLRDEKPLRIGMVQSNIFDYEHLRQKIGAYEVVRQVLDTHYVMSREAIEQNHVDALLWSETVYPTTFGHPKSESGAQLDQEILDFVSAAKVPLVFGTYDRDDTGEYNAAAFVEPAAGTLGFYRKTDLFLLTEYVPEWIDGPMLRGLLPWAGAWKPGNGARVFPLRLADGREIPVLPMVCLDDVDTGLAIDGARLGGQVILGMSNDSWFTQYPVGANLHLNVAAFRSIETRMPQMRVTANGVSAVIDANGSIVASTAMDEKKLLIGEVLVKEPPMTLMVAWGDWVGRAGILWLALLAGFSVVAAFNRRAGNAAKAAVVSTISSEEKFRADAVVLAPAWRFATALLRVCTCGGLLFMGMTVLFGDEAQRNALTQMWMFAALVLAPEVAAWSILRAFAAKMCIENGMLILEQRQRRIEIRVKDIAAVETWKLSLPMAGVNLKLQSGQRWSQGIATQDINTLISTLVGNGGSPALENTSDGFAARYARVRSAIARRRIDHAVVKFLLFPLVPALPAFRLHQHIAYGGTFGEYQTFGLKAYLIALVIWWASWAIGMVLFAALLRVVIEAGTMLSVALRSGRAIDIRKSLELLGHLFFYIGVPGWLLIKFLP